MTEFSTVAAEIVPVSGFCVKLVPLIQLCYNLKVFVPIYCITLLSIGKSYHIANNIDCPVQKH